MKIKLFSLLYLAWMISANTIAQTSIQQYENVDFSNVFIQKGFWKPHVDKVASVTIPVCVYQTEVATPRIRNFEVAAGLKKGKFEGIYYDDSDVYKALEAIAYSLKNNPDKQLELKADEWISKIAKAQQADGYINTFYTLTPKNTRWTDMNMHEAYCGGHLIEAGVAYYNATGKRTLLDVGIRFADHMDTLFGPGKRHWVPGHQEIEIALVKLYKVTQNEKYLKLSDWLLNERGGGHATWKDLSYYLDAKPLVQQVEITGHAVRAMYYYTAAADVAALTGNQAYIKSMKTIWEDVVHRNMYLTGGIGSSRDNEGFTTDYNLPNGSAYCETCASVGMAFWNQRMGELTGESQYVDILEKTLYNGALGGISLSGDHFFYENPLSSNGKNKRKEWFGTACCPSNIARLISSLGDYVYGYSNNSIWVNLFVDNTATIPLKKQKVKMEIATEYPRDGKVKITIEPEKSKDTFTLHIRIPGWLKRIASPGNLYQFRNYQPTSCTISVNGKEAAYTEEKGYIVLKRTWKQGDIVQLEMPMNVLQVAAREDIKSNNNRIAFQRGPIIYCAEGADNNNNIWNIVIPENTKVSTTESQVLSEKIIALTIETKCIQPTKNGVETIDRRVKAIPYYTWCNRYNSQMQIWLPLKIKTIKINDEDTSY